MRKLILLVFICNCQIGYAFAQPANNSKVFNLAAYHPHVDGKTDDTPAFQLLLKERIYDKELSVGSCHAIYLSDRLQIFKGKNAIIK